MKRHAFTSLLAAGLLAVSASPAHAQFTTYTSFASWLAAVGSFDLENFNGFASDASFRNATVALNGMTVTGTAGANGTQSQKVDASPYEFTSVYSPNGTSYLMGDLAGANQFIRFDLTSPLTAWSIETVGISDGGRATTIRVYDANNALLGSIPTSSSSSAFEQQFYGFTLSGGPQASYVTLMNGVDDNDAFGIDNMRFASSTVPEPGSVVLVGAGLLGVAAAARRKRSA